MTLRAIRTLRRWAGYRLARLRRRWTKPAGGPVGRIRRRMVVLTGLIGAIVTMAAFPKATTSTATTLCRMPVLQPQLSDLCGGMHVPGIASRAERLSWEAIAPASCDGLRAYRIRYPEGAFIAKADSRLMRRTVQPSARWVPGPSEQHNAYVGQGDRFPDRAAALADAIARARTDAVDLCSDSNARRRPTTTEVTPRVTNCRASGTGQICGIHYIAVCHIAVRPFVETCR